MLYRFFLALGRNGIYLVAFLLGVVVTYGWFRANFLAPVCKAGTVDCPQQVFFEVENKASITTIAKQLEERKIIKSHYSILAYNKIKAKGGESLKILAGEYELSPSQTPKEIFNILVSGKVVYHNLTIAEGTTIQELPKLIAKASLASEEDVKRSLNDKLLMAKLDIPALIPEGFIFPDTYSFTRPVTAEQIISRIVEEGRKKLDETQKGWKERAAQIGYSPYQILIMASIIEKETGEAGERPIISSVFHNRLRIGMPLQSDPTVIYGTPDFTGNLTKEHLKTPGPYNTYLNPGLPPTPICNPGFESIKAALFPADTDYLYFVARGDGSHRFSATYKEHVNAVNDFLKMAQ